jgi:ribosomal 30S subunit maturation factor RimM
MGTSGLWSCGILGKAHGLHGELYLNLSPGGLEYLCSGTRFYVAGEELPTGGAERLVPCAVTRVGGTDQRPLVRLDLAPTREAALAVQGAELFAAGEELDRLPHYRVGDLVGLRVETSAGRYVGDVVDVIQAPAHEILDILTPDGGSQLVPLVDELVSVDDEAGVLRVRDGLLDEPEDTGRT